MNDFNGMHLLPDPSLKLYLHPRNFYTFLSSSLLPSHPLSFSLSNSIFITSLLTSKMSSLMLTELPDQYLRQYNLQPPREKNQFVIEFRSNPDYPVRSDNRPDKKFTGLSGSYMFTCDKREYSLLFNRTTFGRKCISFVRVCCAMCLPFINTC